MVGQPAQDYQGGTCDGSQSEGEELWVVGCGLADGSVGEGRLVVVVLGLEVDEEEAADGGDGSHFEEEEGREGSLKHQISPGFY